MSKKAPPVWRVLLAEDNDDHALLIEMALERAAEVPPEIIRARNGNEAVAAVQDHEVDLILLDLKMPGRTGHEVLQVVKEDEEFRKIPVAVLTSSDQHEDMARSYGLGGNHFITKPEDPAELEKQLRTLFKNLRDVGGIYRGAGRFDATAVSAMDPDTLAVRKAAMWGGLILVAVVLLAFAWYSGVLGG